MHTLLCYKPIGMLQTSSAQQHTAARAWLAWPPVKLAQDFGAPPVLFQLEPEAAQLQLRLEPEAVVLSLFQSVQRQAIEVLHDGHNTALNVHLVSTTEERCLLLVLHLNG